LLYAFLYASPPSSPGGNAQECHSSSSMCLSQNHLPHVVQRTVAGLSHGSSFGETAWHKRFSSALEGSVFSSTSMPLNLNAA
jgi:hypothetical protein